LGLARALTVFGLGVMPNYRPRLCQIELPVRLVVGELDLKFAQLAENMLPLLPRACLVKMADAGHNLVLERPEAVAELMAQEPWNRA
jgi:pimeloyl-ACP methyl ester carboxylesterase